MSKDLCFCGHVCSEYETKDGVVFLRCGFKANYKDIADRVKHYKSKNEKKLFMQTTLLGCSMNIKLEDYDSLDDGLWSYPPWIHPRCSGHDLLMKTGICHKDSNEGRTFLACPAQYPNISCDDFKWCDDVFKGMEENYKAQKEQRQKLDDGERIDADNNRPLKRKAAGGKKPKWD